MHSHILSTLYITLLFLVSDEVSPMTQIHSLIPVLHVALGLDSNEVFVARIL